MKSNAKWKTVLCSTILSLICLCGHGLAADVAPDLAESGMEPEGLYLSYDVLHDDGTAESMAASEEEGEVWLTCGNETVYIAREGSEYEVYAVNEEGCLLPMGDPEAMHYLSEQRDSLLSYAQAQQERKKDPLRERLGLL